MVNFLENKKRVFWEALLLTVVVFSLGLLIGISFESGKVDVIKNYYSSSEASIMDIFASGNLIDLNKMDCSQLKDANFVFADKIYNEARLLEKYENAGKISDGLIIEHKKYDLLRTLLWVNEMKTAEKCGRDYHTVIYLYEYKQDDLVKKALQNVWSKVLGDLKTQEGSNVLLVPIAVDNDLVSLNSLVNDYNITSYPALIIDDKIVVSELGSVDDLRVYIN